MKTNFDICCESIENMAQMIDIMKCGWTKDQIKIWLQQPCTENECERRLSICYRVPCKIGDTIYVIPSEVNYRLNILSGHEENNRVHEQVVNRIEIGRYGYFLSTCDGMASAVEESYKATWFLTKEEAEAALKCLEGGKGK